MTVRDLIQDLLLNASLDDKVELEVSTKDDCRWPTGKANNVIAVEDGRVVITTRQ